MIHEIGVVWKPTVTLEALEARDRIMHTSVDSERLCRSESFATHITEMDATKVARLDVVT